MAKWRIISSKTFSTFDLKRFKLSPGFFTCRYVRSMLIWIVFSPSVTSFFLSFLLSLHRVFLYFSGINWNSHLCSIYKILLVLFSAFFLLIPLCLLFPFSECFSLCGRVDCVLDHMRVLRKEFFDMFAQREITREQGLCNWRIFHMHFAYFPPVVILVLFNSYCRLQQSEATKNPNMN